MNFKNVLKKILPTVSASAHCDIPCGVYDPTNAKIAAKTVQRMVQQIKEFALPMDINDKKAAIHYLNSVSRRIRVKEEHAQICKNELYILWSDFFKPEHLEKYPALHEMFWKAVKLCSRNKQEVDEGAANELVAEVDGIAGLFYEVKNDPRRFESYKDVTDKLF